MEGEECYTFGPLTVALFDRHSQENESGDEAPHYHIQDVPRFEGRGLLPRGEGDFKPSFIHKAEAAIEGALGHIGLFNTGKEPSR